MMLSLLLPLFALVVQTDAQQLYSYSDSQCRNFVQLAILPTGVCVRNVAVSWDGLLTYVGTTVHVALSDPNSGCAGKVEYAANITTLGVGGCALIINVGGDQHIGGSFRLLGFTAPFNGTLGFALSENLVVVGKAVTLTSTTTPATSDIGISFRDIISNTVIATATTDATGVARATYPSSSPIHIAARAEVNNVHSVIQTLTVRASGSTNTYNDYGSRPCGGNQRVLSQVLDHNMNYGSGSVAFFGNSALIGSSQVLNAKGTTTPLDITTSSNEELAAYYAGTTVGGNVNTWFICS